MLPWLIVPLMVLWALSQLLPPGLRLEVTAPRLACVGVVMLSLCWYELLMPRWSEWRARRSLMLHERRKMEAQEAAKWRKEAVRKCRNCFMAYKDQKPVGGKFMCTYCGHLSKRPALDVPGVGIGQFICRKDLRMQGNKTWTQKMFENDLWPGVWGAGGGSESCIIGWQNSAVLIVFRLVSLVGFCMWWACSKLWGGSMSEGDRMRTERKVGHRRGENGGQESRAEKMKRKAEEKRLARLEKEQMEAEERLQREEVARLVDERRRQRADAQSMETHVEQPEKVKDAGKLRHLVEEDAKKNKEKAKKDKKLEDSCKLNKVADTGVKNEAIGNSLKTMPSKPVTNAATTAKAVVFLGPKHTKPKSPVPVVSVKKEKPPTVSSAKTISSEAKPSAWNRISWAWGKGSVKKACPPLDVLQPGQDSSLVPTTESKETEPLTDTSPFLSPTKPSKPASGVVDHSLPQPPKRSEEAPSPLTTQQPVVSNPMVKETAPSVVSSPFESSVSVYSTFMPLAAVSSPVSDAPAYGTDFVSKSTWKMWEAPNLELPRLTQSLASDGLSLHQPQIPCDSSLLNINPLPPSAANLSGVPISNNMWSNYHAFESTRRIWEDDLHSDSPPPPEFVDCITQEIMKDPVIAADGHSYERTAIEAWLKTHDTSPKTGGVLPSLGSSGAGVDKSLRPNHNLRGQIIEYKECLQRGIPPVGNAWQTTEALKKSRIGSFPGGGSVWAYSSS